MGAAAAAASARGNASWDADAEAAEAEAAGIAGRRVLELAQQYLCRWAVSAGDTAGASIGALRCEEASAAVSAAGPGSAVTFHCLGDTSLSSAASEVITCLRVVAKDAAEAVGCLLDATSPLTPSSPAVALRVTLQDGLRDDLQDGLADLSVRLPASALSLCRPGRAGPLDLALRCGQAVAEAVASTVSSVSLEDAAANGTDGSLAPFRHEAVRCVLTALLGEALDDADAEATVPTAFRYDWSFLFVLAFILAGGVGNILVCLAVILDRRLQNVTNYFLLSLAIADLLVSLFVMPLGAIPGFLGE
ncbi:5-hydroxytryptamine receptor 2B [Frankliniella fusca]|uniref:5-hydroxytryptamine receptor 2B n=1 Tax=Frankliniella fusca TaxID=407009 RepID=A0AAE1LN54_9NEOP|nr:5-hydroxytryptamine receptor 2B [Frankliniella fusca]